MTFDPEQDIQLFIKARVLLTLRQQLGFAAAWEERPAGMPAVAELDEIDLARLAHGLRARLGPEADSLIAQIDRLVLQEVRSAAVRIVRDRLQPGDGS